MAELNSIIKGISYYAEAVRTLALTGNLIPGTTLLPEREPNNSSDRNKRFRQALCPTSYARAIILYPSIPKLLNPNTLPSH